MVAATLETPCYDPVIHITAGELRKLGFLISEIVHDDAFVRRVAVGLDGVEPLSRETCTVKLAVLEMFMEPRSYLALTSPGVGF